MAAHRSDNIRIFAVIIRIRSVAANLVNAANLFETPPAALPFSLIIFSFSRQTKLNPNPSFNLKPSDPTKLRFLLLLLLLPPSPNNHHKTPFFSFSSLVFCLLCLAAGYHPVPPRPSSSPPHNLALWLSSSPLPPSFPVAESEYSHSCSSEFRCCSGWSLPLHPSLLNSCSILRLRYIWLLVFSSLSIQIF
ncbi:uncharacterized protein DS421_14g456850 [Arachis hypogaea]|nr:uncharacterized protein DS421_14g456850 [Arachis hypogaea]